MRIVRGPVRRQITWAKLNNMGRCIQLGSIVLCLLGSVPGAFGQAGAIDPAPRNPGPLDNAERPFNQIAYGRYGNELSARARMNQVMELRLENLERTCCITETQRRKITVACKGDIKRFFDTIEEKRRRLRLAKGDDEREKIWEELSAFSGSLDDHLFNELSLFHKMLTKTLTQDQRARYQADRREAQAFAHRAQVESATEILDMALGLDDDQRERLKRLLLVETRPPKIAAPHRVATLFVLAQTVNLPESKFGPIIRKSQRMPATRFFAKLKQGLARELEAFKVEERGAATTAEAPDPDKPVHSDAAAPKPSTQPVRPPNAQID